MRYLTIDIGNVICDVNFDIFTSEIYRILKIDGFDFLSKIQKCQDLGISSVQEELRYHHGLDLHYVKHLLKVWDKTVKANSIILNELKGLVKQDVKIALLSNMGHEHSTIMRHVLSPQIYDNSIRFFSCDVGARKPTFIYYKTFLDMHPEFRGCVYVDDRQENIDASLLFGFQSCLFGIDTFKTEAEMLEMFNVIKILVLS